MRTAWEASLGRYAKDGRERHVTKNSSVLRTRSISLPAAARAGAEAASVPFTTSLTGGQSDFERVILTESAPAVAMALLATVEQVAGAPAAALECLAAGVSAPVGEGRVRIQLLFANGAVLPVEISSSAGCALMHGLAEELGVLLPWQNGCSERVQRSAGPHSARLGFTTNPI